MHCCSSIVSALFQQNSSFRIISAYFITTPCAKLGYEPSIIFTKITKLCSTKLSFLIDY
ncbi:hypothetical protein MOUN0_J02388 [Monosporozyma unispora]